jgi:hypothetical protein
LLSLGCLLVRSKTELEKEPRTLGDGWVLVVLVPIFTADLRRSPTSGRTIQPIVAQYLGSEQAKIKSIWDIN